MGLGGQVGMYSGVSTAKNSWQLPKRLSIELHVTRHVHSRAYTQETGNSHLPKNLCVSVIEA